MTNLSNYNQSLNNNELMQNLSKTIFYCTGLRCITFKNNKFIISKDEFGNKYEEIIRHSILNLPKSINQNKDKCKNTTFIFNGQFNLDYFVFIPDKNCKLEDTIVIGPYLTSIVDEHFINKLLNSENTLNNREKLKHLYAALHFFDDAKVYYTKKLIELICTNSKIDEAFEKQNSNYSLPPLSNQLISQDAFSSNKNAAELISSEKIFFEYLLQGNAEKVISIYKTSLRPALLIPNSKNPLRVAKNRAIVFVGVISRKMIKGGISPEKALAHEKAYIELIERSTSLIHLSDSIEALILNAATSVIKLNNIEHINTIIRVTKYINKHLSEQIRLPEVAAFVGLSPNYFSSLFKKEMKISFADYVNQMRIKESQYLLKTSNYSILDIAIAVGYSNQNYFTTMFKRFTNITPKQYRLKNL